MWFFNFYSFTCDTSKMPFERRESIHVTKYLVEMFAVWKTDVPLESWRWNVQRRKDKRLSITRTGQNRSACMVVGALALDVITHWGFFFFFINVTCLNFVAQRQMIEGFPNRNGSSVLLEICFTPGKQNNNRLKLHENAALV